MQVLEEKYRIKREVAVVATPVVRIVAVGVKGGGTVIKVVAVVAIAKPIF